MAGIKVKEEYIEQQLNNSRKSDNIPVIDLESSEDDDDDNDNENDEYSSSNGKRFRVSNNNNNENNKKLKKNVSGVVLPEGFLDPLPPRVSSALRNKANENRKETEKGGNHERVKRNYVSCNKQFWKAGDFEDNSFSTATTSGPDWNITSGGMDHLRVHPRFLHSNATSHKWVLGAFAELLDNSLDEVCNGATYVKIDMLINKKDDSRMLLIEDNGGGMDPEKMRHCMSLGYSLKSKVKDTIGQYGNGFKTSTMRLGADVIVFSRSAGKDGKRSTQSIGMLSYTFLRSTGKEDIVVPMLDYERREQEWKNMNRVSASDWDRNVEALVQWSPFSSEADFLRQFDNMKAQGTRIIIYNLWEDDQGQLELDFDTDKQDIQIRGVNRDEQNIKMAQEHPNSRHFLTYRHSLRIYASILYLRVPHNFRMILRGKDIVHHNIINDMMMTNEVTYRPHPGHDGLHKDSNMVAVVTVGFVKDAKAHIDVQGFNVYHKNRLIKPFWRIWNATGSDGRGVIGVLEANFVEPAHDKQGFERTNVLQRLETRLIQMQKTYWYDYCHKIGYAPRRQVRRDSEDREPSPDYTREAPPRRSSVASDKAPPVYTREAPPRRSSVASDKAPPVPHSDKFSPHINQKGGTNPTRHPSDTINNNVNIGDKSHRIFGKGASSSESTSPLIDNNGDDDSQTPMTTRYANDIAQIGGSSAHKTRSVSAREAKHPEPGHNFSSSGKAMQVVTPPHLRSPGVNGNVTVPSNYSTPEFLQLVEENRELKERLRRREEEILGDLLHDLESERRRCKELEAQLESEKQRFEVLNKEQDSIIAIFSEERERRDTEEEALRKKLKETEVTTKNLMEKVTQLQLEKMKTMGRKWGQ